MINFLTQHKDEIIMLIIGVLIGGVMTHISKFFWKCLLKLKEQIMIFYSFLKRRISGNYNLNELEKMLSKPENKLSKRELRVVNQYKENQKGKEQLRNVLTSIREVQRRRH